jgi:hypothetical protein
MFEAQLRLCTVECPLGFGATVPGFPQDFGDFPVWCFVESVGRNVPKNGVQALARKVRASSLVAIGALYGRTDSAAVADVLLSQLKRQCRVAAVQCPETGPLREIIHWHRDGVGLFATSSAPGTQLTLPITQEEITWSANLRVVDEYHKFSDELCEGVALRELHNLCMRDRKPSPFWVHPVSGDPCVHLRR